MQHATRKLPPIQRDILAQQRISRNCDAANYAAAPDFSVESGVCKRASRPLAVDFGFVWNRAFLPARLCSCLGFGWRSGSPLRYRAILDKALAAEGQA